MLEMWQAYFFCFSEAPSDADLRLTDWAPGFALLALF
jgi:hypothetical protein